jgi:hypothetical protein
MTVKEWLNRGYRIDVEINALLEEQAAAFRRAAGATTGGGEKVQTSKRNTSEDRLVNYAAYSELIDRRIDELYAIKTEIAEAIGKVDDNTLRTLLTLRYINFETWEQIAVNMHYCRVHITRNLHPKALQALSKTVTCFLHETVIK